MARFALLSLVLTPLVAAADAPDAAQSSAAVAALRAELEKGTTVAELAGKPFASTPLTKPDAATARNLIVKAHAVRITRERAAEVKERVLMDGKLEMRYTSTTFGKKPTTGWSLWISLHGGGNTAAKVNDQQWSNQKSLYTLDEGLYVAPRAPTNTWNLWHEPHIDRLFGRLIEDMIAIEGVDPDRVYVLGYSAGGDGVYQLAPRMADRWAAAAMMAGHPNDASPLGLRNVPFALQVGGKDAAYNRNMVAEEWGKRLDQLRKDDPGGYDHFVKVYPDKGHWMDREDRVALPWMAKHRRNPVPDRVVWEPKATTDRMYWLAVPGGTQAGGMVVAVRAGQTVEIVKAEKVAKLLVRLDDRMLDVDRPVSITNGGKVLFEGTVRRTVGTMARTLADRGDPGLVFAAEVIVAIP